MNDKAKQPQRTAPKVGKPEVYGPYNRADLEQCGYFRIGLDQDRIAGTKPKYRTRPVRRRVLDRDDGYER